MAKQINPCPLCGAKAKRMKDASKWINCSDSRCMLGGDRFFHINRWNENSLPGGSLFDAIEKAGHQHYLSFWKTERY